VKARTKELWPSARFDTAKFGWVVLAAKKAGSGGSGTLKRVKLRMMWGREKKA